MAPFHRVRRTEAHRSACPSAPGHTSGGGGAVSRGRGIPTALRHQNFREPICAASASDTQLQEPLGAAREPEGPLGKTVSRTKHRPGANRGFCSGCRTGGSGDPGPRWLARKRRLQIAERRESGLQVAAGQWSSGPSPGKRGYWPAGAGAPLGGGVTPGGRCSSAPSSDGNPRKFSPEGIT